MEPDKLKIQDILIEDRQRKDYGDIDELAECIEKIGMIHPVVLSKDNGSFRLLAGGRRIEALKSLGQDTLYHGTTCDPERPGFVWQTELTEDLKFEIELEENVRRKAMTWQERLCTVAKIHNLKVRRNALEGKKWGYRQTGILFGIALGRVEYSLRLAKEIQTKPEGPVAQAASVTDALRILLQRDEDNAARELATRTLAGGTISGAKIASSGTSADRLPVVEGNSLPPEIGDPVEQLVMEIPLNSMLHHTDCLEYMRAMKEGSVDHVITDLPYAIDMNMLDQQNPHGGMNDIDRIAETHGVEDNIRLFRQVIPAAFRVIDARGFFVTWCDQMLWQALYDLGVAAGFRVQRWPITWVKMHQCMNQCAQYNFTKNTEIAIVMRKPSATLVSPAPTCIVMAANDPEAKKLGHPFVKPFAVWEKIIRHVASPGQTILEPCAGVGSGVLSMLQMGMKVIACEIDEKHHSNLVNNVADFYRKHYPNCKFV